MSVTVNIHIHHSFLCLSLYIIPSVFHKIELFCSILFHFVVLYFFALVYFMMDSRRIFVYPCVMKAAGSQHPRTKWIKQYLSYEHK